MRPRKPLSARIESQRVSASALEKLRASRSRDSRGGSLESKISLSLRAAEQASQLDTAREALSQSRFELRILFGKMLNQFSVDCRSEHSALQRWTRQAQQKLGLLNVRFRHVCSMKPDPGASPADLDKEFYFQYLRGSEPGAGPEHKEMALFCADLDARVEFVGSLNCANLPGKSLRMTVLDREIKRLRGNLKRVQDSGVVPSTRLCKAELALAEVLLSKGVFKAEREVDLDWVLADEALLEYSVDFLK